MLSNGAFRALCHVAFQDFFDLCLRDSSYDLIYELALLEDQHGGNRHYSETSRGCHVFIGVQLSKGHFPPVLFRQSVNDGPNDAAGSAPGGPAVNKGKLIP